jgi:hypothetical protein
MPSKESEAAGIEAAEVVAERVALVVKAAAVA